MSGLLAELRRRRVLSSLYGWRLRERPIREPRSKRKNGADDPTRTDDLLITSELLFQLSFVGPEAESANRRN